MHLYKHSFTSKGSQFIWRVLGVMVIGVLFLAACSPSSSASPTSTVAVPATGATATGAATSASMPTTAATSAATGTTAATSAATSAATGTVAATSAATMASTGTAAATTGTPAATSAAYGTGTGTPSAAATAPASVALTVKTSSSLGQYLADDKGMTLYTFSKDTNGTSACSGQCAAIWPPLMVTKGGQVTLTGGGDSTKLGTITRADGTTQVTYNNQPLYYYAKDKAPGDTTGQGVGGVWSIAKP